LKSGLKTSKKPQMFHFELRELGGAAFIQISQAFAAKAVKCDWTCTVWVKSKIGFQLTMEPAWAIEIPQLLGTQGNERRVKGESASATLPAARISSKPSGKIPLSIY